LLAEIQQTSDITYRIYDWDRVDSNGKPRELHNDLALDVIDFKEVTNAKWTKPDTVNKTAELASCPYFTVNRLTFTDTIKRNYDLLDSFVIYMCLAGEASIIYGKEKSERIVKGETVLIPSELKDVILKPNAKCQLLEIFVK
ncbi:MAG TPA: mannose-6-phosphate isomerase, partial [Tenuifilaceae bacterium]|nr:mannose-6-phosphate isomerase [Tenuifilaceae bacterium]